MGERLPYGLVLRGLIVIADNDLSAEVFQDCEECPDMLQLKPGFSGLLPREPKDGDAYEAAACENHMMRGAAYRAFNTPNRRDNVLGFCVARGL